MGPVSEPGYPQAWEADVLLRDGHPIHLRPITPGDGDALRVFHAGLSPRTVYFRFFSAKPELTDADVEYFTHVDHEARVALVALDRHDIIGVGRFDALGDGRAEVAFLIRDDMQGLGLGSVLLEHLAAAARERGVTRFVAEVLPANSRMLSTFRAAGYALTQQREDDVIAVGFDIEPTAESLAVMAAREHRAEARSMARMLRPQSVAVVGASRTGAGLGSLVLRHLVEGGFRGELVAVHREADALEGVRCVRSLADVDGAIDLVVVVVPAPEVPALLADAAAAEVHGLVVVSGGFGEADGLDLQRRLVATVTGTGMRLVGPNALGIINTDPGVLLNASLVPALPERGRAGFFCQSGALGSSLLERFAQRGLGVSSFVSAGNRADVSGNDLLQYWEEDPATDLVLLHLETIGNARKFARIVHRLARSKPVIMVRTGGTEQVHPLGHAVARTALTQRAVDQILADCGLTVVDGVDRMIDAARVAVGPALPGTDAVAVIGNSDALAVLAVNALARHGLSPLGAPVTFARQEPADAYREALHAAVHDPAAGAVIVVYVPPVEASSDAGIETALRSCAECDGDSHPPVVAVMARQPAAGDAGGIPVFVDVESAVQAIADARSMARWRAADAHRAAAERAARDTAEEEWPEPDLPAGPTVLDGADAIRLLAQVSRSAAVLDLDSTGVSGCEIRLVDDPLFGMVLSVGVDDPVAAALDDRCHRLAPVSPAGAAAMLAGLGAGAVLTHGMTDPVQARAVLAQAISDVSHLHLRAPGVTGAVLRQVSARRDAGDDLTLGEISVTVSADAASAEPAARRL
jgi:acyl-CoA synthetase (NDP forming)/GNAT superfamily N-acetyltransferase